MRFELLESREMLSGTTGDRCWEFCVAPLPSPTSLVSEIAQAPIAVSRADLLEQIDLSGLSLIEADMLNLSSCPSSNFTIYLDFDGHITSGTTWNSAFTGNNPFTTPRFTMDGNTSKSAFTETELLAIYEIWLRVSEDFLPFHVNVTTKDPGSAALIKTNPQDFAWGIRCCIGGTYSSWYGGQAGGIAYVGSFNDSSDLPCFIFSESLSRNIKYVAEAASHEIGHTLGLNHDGNSLVAGQGEYYNGANGWAPIMGASYYSPLTQWSKGEYVGATNTENDLNILTTQNGFTYRTDDHGNTWGWATPIALQAGIVASGIIERNTDRDFFALDGDGNEYTFKIGGITGATNLNVLVRLYDSGGNPIQVIEQLGSLNVEFTWLLPKGIYYLSVEGTGDSTTFTPSDYGSLGAYTIRVTHIEVLMTVDTLTVAVETNDYCDGTVFQIVIDLFSSFGFTGVEWVINWGDGTFTDFAAKGTYLLAVHYYPNEGAYSINLSVRGVGQTFAEHFRLATHVVSHPLSQFSKPIFQQLSILQVLYFMEDAGEMPAFPVKEKSVATTEFSVPTEETVLSAIGALSVIGIGQETEQKTIFFGYQWGTTKRYSFTQTNSSRHRQKVTFHTCWDD